MNQKADTATSTTTELPTETINPGDIYCQICLKEDGKVVKFSKLTGKCGHVLHAHQVHWSRVKENHLQEKIKLASPSVPPAPVVGEPGELQCKVCFRERKLKKWDHTFGSVGFLKRHMTQKHGVKRSRNAEKIEVPSLPFAPSPICTGCGMNLTLVHEAHNRTVQAEYLKNMQFVEQHPEAVRAFLEKLGK